MPTLLLELFSEEIPSRMQKGAAEQLERLITAGCAKAGLKHGAVRTYVSPRHLAIAVAELPDAQPDVSEEKKGPRVDAPAQALDGFFKGAGIPQENAEVREIGGARYFFAVIHRKGRPTAEVAQDICEAALAAFTWPKSMRWGAHELQWVRPLHRIACLLDRHTVPVRFGHLTAGSVTEGHRFLSPGAIALHAAADYEDKLKAAHVLADPAKRRDSIRSEVARLAEQHSLSVIADDALLDEVTGLVEWPLPLLGRFDAQFLTLPPEVLISEMKVHQRYFALADKSGKLANGFIAVANMQTKDEGKSVIAGNERVLRARLSDGAFYWEQDRKKPLSDWAKGLNDVVFHAKVGTMGEKVARIEKLALAIADAVGFKDTGSVSRAALLCKADLTTGMVGEFPELQGIMGRYYALAQGEKPEIADAIRDHYKPLGPNDSLPASDIGAIVALADKLDSITSLFAAGEKPTGSKDPFALRRAALGVLRILRARHLEARGEIDLALYANAEVIEFFRERLRGMLKDTIRHDAAEAAFHADRKGFDPCEVWARAQALLGMTQSDKATIEAIKRVLNILAAEEKKAKATFTFDAKKMQPLREPAEKELYAALKKAQGDIANAIESPPFALEALNTLTAPINLFFDNVLVNADEPGLREARLSLLAGIREAASQIADFSKIEG